VGSGFVGVLIVEIWHIAWIGSVVFFVFLIGQLIHLLRNIKNNESLSSIIIVRLPKKYDKQLVAEVFTGDIINNTNINNREYCLEICSAIRKRSVSNLQSLIGGGVGAIIVSISSFFQHQILINMVLIIFGMLLGVVFELMIRSRVRKIEEVIRFE
jgi:hypothetical protein